MKKKWFLYFFLAFVASNYAQSNNSEERFIRVLKDKRYGLYNTKGKEIIPPIYNIIFNGKEDDKEIKLRLNREEYIFNKKTYKIQKNKITNLKFEELYDFYEDLARIKINDKYGFIGRSGKLVIPPVYSIVDNFSKGLAMVSFDKKNYGFIDNKGKKVIPFEYNSGYKFLNRLVCVSKNENENKNKKVGLIDRNGKEIIEFKYDGIANTLSGLFKVELGDKFGLIDEKGSMITPVKYDEIDFFNDSLAIVKEGDKYGLINKEGESVNVKYDNTNSFSNGNEKVELGKESRIIDKAVKKIEPINCREFQSYIGDLRQIKLNDKWGIVNDKEEQIADFKFDKIISSSFFIVGVKDKDVVKPAQFLWGIINPYGKEIIAPQYLGIGNLSEDLIRVEFAKGGFETHNYGCLSNILQIPGKWGFINMEGKEVISPTYNYAKDFSEGLAAVKNNRRQWGFINKKNEEVIPFVYDRVQNFRNGFSMVQVNRKWGLIDKTGKIIIPIDYDGIDDFVFIPGDYRDKDEMNVPTDRYGYETD